jgi:hypothetical protein
MAEIEFVMLCDAAQSIDGKLYILGGAWSQIRRQTLENTPPQQQPPTQFAIAASIEVDWNEANDPILFQIKLEDADGTELLKVEAQFVTGRPPVARPMPLRATVATPVSMVFPGAGDYAARALLPNQGRERVASFTVVDSVVPRS